MKDEEKEKVVEEGSMRRILVAFSRVLGTRVYGLPFSQ